MISARYAKQIRRGILDGRADNYIFPDTPEGHTAEASFPHYVQAFFYTRIRILEEEARLLRLEEQSRLETLQSYEITPEKGDFGLF